MKKTEKGKGTAEGKGRGSGREEGERAAAGVLRTGRAPPSLCKPAGRGLRQQVLRWPP